jgi:hypothetical protein
LKEKGKEEKRRKKKKKKRNETKVAVLAMATQASSNGPKAVGSNPPTPENEKSIAKLSFLTRLKSTIGLDRRLADTPVQHEGEDDGGNKSRLQEVQRVLSKFVRFMGPGAIISVAYIDPDNYQTNLQAGQSFQYKLLFMILVANIIAIYLQVSSQIHLFKEKEKEKESS